MNEKPFSCGLDASAADMKAVLPGMRVGWPDRLDEGDRPGDLEPVLGAANRNARICILGRDPGRDEVKGGEPFVGAAGKKLRCLLKCAGVDPKHDVYWANTVPYKPKGNKAWPMGVLRLFHQPTLELLDRRWGGVHLITLGSHAFKWFRVCPERMVDPWTPKSWDQLWAPSNEDRFGPASFHSITLKLSTGELKEFRVHPLPHPSPLNRTHSKAFPDLLRARLKALGFGSNSDIVK